MVKLWQETARRLVGDFKIFKFWEIDRKSPRTDLVRPYMVLEADDWCNIIPVTPAGNVVLIHQYRHGTAAITIEVPGGIVDPHESDPAQAAERELLEETGYSAEKIVKLGMVEANPAFLSNHCHLYLAIGAKRVQEPELGIGEDIFVEEVPLEQAMAYIKHGKIQHTLTVSAFHFLGLWCDDNPDGLML